MQGGSLVHRAIEDDAKDEASWLREQDSCGCGMVTDDVWIFEVPKLKVCALQGLCTCWPSALYWLLFLTLQVQHTWPLCPFGIHAVKLIGGDNKDQNLAFGNARPPKISRAHAYVCGMYTYYLGPMELPDRGWFGEKATCLCLSLWISPRACLGWDLELTCTPWAESQPVDVAWYEEDAVTN
ncbi:hypothetical protein STEG23_030803 [Scotinomys teguina]